MALSCGARNTWNELNIGPFYVDVDGDLGSARVTLAQLEQLRWILGNLLESKDLLALWPIRIVITKAVAPSIGFVWQNGQYVFALPPGATPPLDRVSELLIEANTPRLPNDIEPGLTRLLSTLDAHGSHVSWGGPVAQPSLSWARMQLFATRPEYAGRFHILMTNLRDNSGLSVAERNAFGKDPVVIEKEVAANLSAHNWEAVPVSGRPLDPKHDFGEHTVDALAVGVYLADLEVHSNRKSAEAAYKSAIEAGGASAALGFEAMAQLALLDKEDPKPFLEDAIRVGSRSAPVYLHAAEVAVPADVMPLLKRAELLNPRWAEPVLAEAAEASDPQKKEELLKKAAALSPRSAKIWQDLAELQLANGHVSAAQGTWLRAENAAATDEERNLIHQRRLDFEEKRLDAAEAARRRARHDDVAEDQRAQSSEADRIRAAEERANHANDAEAGGDKPANTVSWADLNTKKVQGLLTRVDCSAAVQSLSITSVDGKTVTLNLRKPAAAASLSCGPQKPPKKVAVSYSPQGEVLQLSLQ